MGSDYLFARPSFVEGMARLWDFAGTLNDYNYTPPDEDPDAEALARDWYAVGDDLLHAMAAFSNEQREKVA